MKKLLISFTIPFLSFGQNIGDFYQGGIVFYIQDSGKGLLVDSAYLNASYPWSGLDEKGNMFDNMVSDWGPYLHYCFGTENQSLGTGKLNTSNFVADHPEGEYAANICDNSNSGGFSDWFLPSKDELWAMMQNIEVINSTCNVLGGDIIDANSHWSSSQVVPTGNSTNYAYAVSPFMTSLETGDTFPLMLTKSKNMPYLVRAVRCIDDDCDFESIPTIELITPIINKKLIKTIDVLGRESNNHKELSIEIYYDGSVEKKYIIKRN